jgi:branched-chain amino acid transport system permease protein
VLRAKSIYGPYERKIVLQKGNTNINGPHQGGLVELENGETWFMHFQSAGAIGRVCHLQPVQWVDDWPLMGVDGEPVTIYSMPNVEVVCPVCVPQTSDEFNSTELKLQWQWNHNPVDEMWSLTERPGYLRLKAMLSQDILHARNTSVIILIIITIGVSTFLKGMGLIIWGTNPKQLSPFINMKPIHFMGAVINPQSILIVIVLFHLVSLLYLFFEKTYIGSALRASEKNPRAARLMGINTSTMSALAFTLAAALGAVAGIMIAPITDATYEMGFMIGIKGFVGMVIGGMHSVPGAVAGALLVGLLETFSSAYISTFYSDAITFTVLIFFLFIKPNGIFAKASGERV